MRERKTVHRWWWVWNFEKEELWLNEMAQSGWLLEKVGFCTFDFVACEPGSYTIRLEMHPGDDAYLDFMKETGAEYVGRCVQWIYFRKDIKYGAFDIFSDIDSKIDHLNKISHMIFLIAMANLLIGLVNSFNPTHVGWMNLLCCSLLMYGLGRIHGKKEALAHERLLRE